MSIWDGGLLPAQQPRDIVEWAEANVVLTEALAGKGAGPLKVRPEQVEILRTIDQRLTRRCTICFYSRAGKSTIAQVVISKNIAIDQTSALFVLPSRELLKDWNAQKMEPFLQCCPAANALVKRNRSGELSEYGIDYIGGARKIHYRTGRVAGGLKQLTAELAWADEVDDCDVASQDGFLCRPAAPAGRGCNQTYLD